jgi:hypothetical protein
MILFLLLQHHGVLSTPTLWLGGTALTPRAADPKSTRSHARFELPADVKPGMHPLSMSNGPEGVPGLNAHS